VDKTISLVINARFQSTRIPNKLLRNFSGTCLLEIALNRLLQIKSYPVFLAAADQIIINLYKEKYKDTSIQLLIRTPEAVQKGFNDYRIAWKHYELVPTDFIFCANPCLPFIKVGTYEKAIDYFMSDDKLKTLTSVKSSSNTFFDNDFRLINDKTDVIRSTSEYKVYEIAHAFHIFDKEYFMENGKFWDYTPGNPGFFEIDRNESIDVDEPLDFIMAEKLYEQFGPNLDLNNFR
jgi:CMP-N-acetylneuraminic acid synthetase